MSTVNTVKTFLQFRIGTQNVLDTNGIGPGHSADIAFKFQFKDVGSGEMRVGIVRQTAVNKRRNLVSPRVLGFVLLLFNLGCMPEIRIAVKQRLVHHLAVMVSLRPQFVNQLIIKLFIDIFRRFFNMRFHNPKAAVARFVGQKLGFVGCSDKHATPRKRHCISPVRQPHLVRLGGDKTLQLVDVGLVHARQFAEFHYQIAYNLLGVLFTVVADDKTVVKPFVAAC